MMKNNCRWHGGKARNVMFTVFDNIVLHAGHETNVRLMEEVPEGVTKCGCVSWKVQFFVITGKQKLNIPNQCSHVLPTAGWECVFPGSAVITCLRLLVFYRARFSWQFSVWDDGVIDDYDENIANINWLLKRGQFEEVSAIIRTCFWYGFGSGFQDFTPHIPFHVKGIHWGNVWMLIYVCHLRVYCMCCGPRKGSWKFWKIGIRVTLCNKNHENPF